MEFHRAAETDGVLILVADNEIDSYSGGMVIEELQHSLNDTVRTLIVDCSHVGYVSTIAICTLIRLHKRLTDYGGELRLAAVQPPLLRVLTITRLSKVFPIFPSVEEAQSARQEHAEA
jgi:anti-sigma B factor antagonist